MFKFEKKFGSWYCMHNNNIVYMTDELAFAFSNDDPIATLHQHGSIDKVEKWADNFRKRLTENVDHLTEDQKIFAKQMADDLIVISSTDWDVEEIQKFIDISGYIGVWYKKQTPSNEALLKYAENNPVPQIWFDEIPMTPPNL